MAKIYQGAVELIGNTPLVEVINLEQQEALKARVLVKLAVSRIVSPRQCWKMQRQKDC